MIYLGIDPGLDGAIAYVGTDPHVVHVVDTPTLTVTSSAGSRREYNLAEMRNLLTLYHVDMAFVEKVHSMPGQGVRSMFTMGAGYGAWLGLLAGLQIPTTLVTPQRWKKVMLADQGQDKDASRLRAIQLFPTEAAYFARKKDDGRAEAALIAEYGRRNG